MAKYEKTERLEKVPMEYLWEGLVLSDNLYNYNGSVLLVPSGEVITKSKLDKLINFSDGNNYITTFRGSYEYIMKGKDRPAEIQQKMLENRTGYTELRKGTGERRSGCRSVSCQKDHRRTGGDNSSQKKG